MTIAFHKYVVALFCAILIGTNAYGQNRPIDSLLNLIKKDKPDTNKVNHLNDLAWELMYSNPDTSILISGHALQLAEKLNASPDQAIAKAGKNDVAQSLGQLGVYYWLKADHLQALRYSFKALKIKEELANKKSIASTLGNIGNIYSDQANYPKALEYYFKALKMAEELGNKNLYAINLTNIAVVYSKQYNYPKALDYFFKALNIKKELGDKNSISIGLSNIGSVYSNQAQAESNSNVKKELFRKALDYYFKALKMEEELGNNNAFAINLGNIGVLYTKTGKFAEAEKYLNHSLILCDSVKALNYTMEFEKHLSQLYDTTGQVKLAFAHYKKYIAVRDSLNSEENQKKQVRTEINHEYEKKEALAKAEQDKKDLIAEEEKQKQKLFLLFTICGLAVVVIVSIFIFRSLQINKKKNRIISEQKNIVEHQKKIVEEKQKEILDSIHYAKRIQTALLTTEKYINRNLTKLK